MACDAQGNVRYCLSYAGGDCGDIGVSGFHDGHRTMWSMKGCVSLV